MPPMAVVANITRRSSAVEHVQSADVREANASPPTNRSAAASSAKNQGYSPATIPLEDEPLLTHDKAREDADDGW
jgi:hypothetical protein